MTLLGKLNPPKFHPKEEFFRILSADFDLNHQNREYDLTHVNLVMLAWADQGSFIYCAPKVMFTCEQISDKVVEFHSINGGSAKDLTAGVQELLNFFAPHFEQAVTYFDNPKVLKLLQYITYPTILQNLNEGLDRTYGVNFLLKG